MITLTVILLLFAAAVTIGAGRDMARKQVYVVAGLCYVEAAVCGAGAIVLAVLAWM